MPLYIFIWTLLLFLSLGIPGINLLSMRRMVRRPWKIVTCKEYEPKVSIIVPTYNEACHIDFKLLNLVRLSYPKNLMQIVIVDSDSKDGTISTVRDFVRKNPEFDFAVIAEKERKGKSAALNLALKSCTGEVIIVSDSDSFWPSDVLEKTMPFLADPTVGAVSGPKVLLNADQSWVTKTEELYLKSLNLRRLGESKLGSTLFFEGGFSAFKRNTLTAFDQYNTGSDDNGTVIHIIEKNLRTIFLPEARFFTFFPATWSEKINIKIRRANQVVRVCSKYASLLLRREIAISKRVILQDILINIASPIAFVLFLLVSVPMVFQFPYFLLFLLVFLLPKIGLVISELAQSYFILFFALISLAFKKRFVIWNIPARESVFREELLRSKTLI